MKLFKHMTLAAIVGLTLTSQVYAKIVVDEFNEDPSHFVQDTVVLADSPGPAHGPIGDLSASRTLEVKVETGGGQATLSSNNLSSDELRFDVNRHTTDTSAWFAVVWTFDDGSGGGVDLTEGGINTGFILNNFSWNTTPDQDLVVTLEVASPESTATTVLIDGTIGDKFVGFSQFSSSVPFTSATTIRLRVDSTDAVFGDADFSLDSLIISTPEPASLALLGMGAFGLFGFGYTRRRKGQSVDMVG